MSTDIQAFSDPELRMRWQEPYLTEGLNAKLAVNTPAGTYRGFRLASNAANLTITVAADSTAQDHVAVYETLSGYSITIRRPSGPFNLSLTAFQGQTIVLAIFATYAIGTPTAAVIRAYQLAPMDEFTGAAERPELVVLGQVVVPALVAPIPAANITPTFRTEAWEKTAPEVVPWAPVLQNSSFEWVLGGGSFFVERWERGTGVTWTTTAGAGNTGVQALTLVGAVAAQTGRLHQWVNVTVAPGQILKLRLFLRVLQVPNAGTVEIFVEWGDQLGNVNPAETLISVPTTAFDPVYREIETLLEVPLTASVVRRVGLKITGVTFPAAGNAVFFDDFQCFVETNGPLVSPGYNEKMRSEVSAYPLVLGDPTTNMAALAGMMRYDNSTPVNEGQIVCDYSNEATTASFALMMNLRGRLKLGDRLLASVAQANKPRITMTQSGNSLFTPVAEFPVPGGILPTTRLYTFLGARLYITENAVWDANTGLWNKDTAGVSATKIELGIDRIVHGVRDAANNAPWTDGGWDSLPINCDTTTFVNKFLGIFDIGSGLLTTQVDSLQPRIRANAAPNAVSTRTCMWEGAAPGSHSFRMYRVDVTGDMEFTQNARWTGTQWTRDSALFHSSRFTIGGSGLYGLDFFDKTGVAPWADNAWSPTNRAVYDAPAKMLDVGDGGLYFFSTTSGADGSNPPQGTPIANQLRAINIPKAWGVLQTAGGGMIGFTQNAGIGFSGATIVGGANGLVQVNLSTPMSSLGYAIVMSGQMSVAGPPPLDAGGRGEPHLYLKTFTNFQFYWKDGNVANPLNPVANALGMMFAVFGPQAT